MPINAGVIVKTKFIDPTSHPANKQKFQDYISYIDRTEAVRNQNFYKFSLYNDYMGNPEKSGALFTADLLALNSTQKQQVKNIFQTACQNDSIMWQSVISFDNQFLEQIGVFDSKTGFLDDTKLKECTRSMMAKKLQKENLEHSAFWTASIHLNTDNIHIHVATVEPYPMRQYKTMPDGSIRRVGRLKQSTLTAMKSAVVNTLVRQDRSIMDQLARRQIIQHVPHLRISVKREKIFDQFISIYRKLPPDKRMWFYHMNTIHSLKPQINMLSDMIIQEYFPSEFQQFSLLLHKQQQSMIQAYGQNSHASSYAKNKMDDFYARMGNAVLKEMRKFDKKQRLLQRKHTTHTPSYSENQYQKLAVLSKLKQSLSSAFNTQKKLNQLEHQKLEYDQFSISPS